MDFLADYGVFFAKTFTVLVALIILIIVSVALGSRDKLKKGRLNVTLLNDKFKAMRKTLKRVLLNKAEFKADQKTEKKEAKAEKKKTKRRKRVFLINFHGDIKASNVNNLREEITALLTIATPRDEVVVCLESPGGVVHGYGLAASQLQRLRDKHIPLTAVIDKVAASGGYMMACVADRILAAPFAIIGSIGVISQFPNFNRFLKKHNIDFEQTMAGEYKRTLSIFGENSEQGRKKYQEDINDIHNIFKAFVSKHRPQLANIDKVATGEHWLASKAHELNLVDELITSDDYLMKLSKDRDIYEVRYATKKTLLDKLGKSAHMLLSKLVFAVRQEQTDQQIM